MVYLRTTEFIQGDELSGSCTIGFSLEDERDPIQDPVDGPGRYVVTWCRWAIINVCLKANFEFYFYRVLQNGTHGPTAISYFHLPSLRPPVDTIVALLDVPPQGALHVPMLLTLTIRNYHSTRSANIVVQLEPDSMDGFVVSGLRNGRVPVLLPGSEEKLIWNIIPIECGFVKVPRIKVTDRRKAIPGSQGSNEIGANVDAVAGDLIKVVNIRRGVRQDDIQIEGSDSVNQSSIDEQEVSVTVLVLP
jgi:trafficking protein particle complex subunit 11